MAVENSVSNDFWSTFSIVLTFLIAAYPVCVKSPYQIWVKLAQWFHSRCLKKDQRLKSHTSNVAIENANIVDECRSKIVRNRVLDCHLSPNWRQMTIKNTVSIDFWFLFVDCEERFRLPPTRCESHWNTFRSQISIQRRWANNRLDVVYFRLDQYYYRCSSDFLQNVSFICIQSLIITCKYADSAISQFQIAH